MSSDLFVGGALVALVIVTAKLGDIADRYARRSRARRNRSLLNRRYRGRHG